MEFLESQKIVYNQSLPMPVIRLLLKSRRNINSSRPFLHFNYCAATFNRQPIPDWALYNYTYQDATHANEHIYINAVDATNYERAKTSSTDWPLRTEYVTGESDNGFRLECWVNSSHFLETTDKNEKDELQLKITSFDIDPNDIADMKGVPEYFRLLPCDVLVVTVTLQQHHLINRAESPCRNDYPAELKKLINTPMKPQWLYNAMLAPDLPYDQRVCDNLCASNYWLPKCNCMISYEAYYYAGGADNASIKYCPEDLENADSETIYGGNGCVMQFAYSRTPVNEFTKCKCYKKCDGYFFMISAFDKFRLRTGKKMVFEHIRTKF